MIKMKTLSLILFLIPTLLHAQKIQVKKDVVIRDGEPIAKVEGKTSFTKTDMTIKSLREEPLVQVQSVWVKFGYPFHPIWTYYTIKFVKADKSVSIIADMRSSERKLIEFLYEKIGNDFLTKEGLNESAVSSFVASADQSEKIHNDSIRTIGIVKHTTEKLKEPVPDRNRQARLNLILVDAKDVRDGKVISREVFDAFQDDKLVARVVKNQKSGMQIGTRIYEYIVMRSVSPFTVGNETFSFADMALIEANSDPEYKPEIHVQGCDRTWALDVKFKPASGEYSIVSWLIEKGCL